MTLRFCLHCVRVTGSSDDLDVDAILEVLEGMHADEALDPNEGLRERKKRRVRQKISDVATAMFLVHGFDNVTVAQIAAACEVSEQTVFNYFPTKESMFFDRSEPMTNAVADAVRERGSASLVEAVVQSMADEIHPSRWEALDEAGQLHLFRRFCNVATGSPTLVAARFADFATLHRRGIHRARATHRRRPGRPRGAARHARHRRPRPSPTGVNLSPRQASDFTRRAERRRPSRRPQGCPARRADPHRIRQHARHGGPDPQLTRGAWGRADHLRKNAYGTGNPVTGLRHSFLLGSDRHVQSSPDGNPGCGRRASGQPKTWCSAPAVTVRPSRT